MNKNIFFTACICCFYTIVQAQNVSIPDANFKAYLVNNVDLNTNGDGEIQVSEAQAFSDDMDVSNRNITSLVGIQAFIALEELDCSGNQLTGLDVSNNANLEKLDCSGNQLTGLDISNNTNLEELNCGSNQLTGLDVSNNANLEELDCSGNQLTGLDISNNANLEELNCGSNQLTGLDISNNTNLEKLNCNGNQLTGLDISNNTNLEELKCAGNQLNNLDVSNNPKLEKLNCAANQLTSLDVSNNTDLENLICSNNQLIYLNVKNGKNTDLDLFDASNNSNLACIQVDDPVYSANNWPHVDATASFNTTCPLVSTTIIQGSLDVVELYPNPTATTTRVVLGKSYENIQLQLSNARGQVVLEKSYNHQQTIDLNIEGVAGLYWLTIATEEGMQTLKLAKE